MVPKKLVLRLLASFGGICKALSFCILLVGAEGSPVTSPGLYVSPDQLLSKEIENYINPGLLSQDRIFETGANITIQYSGFSISEMKRNASELPAIRGYKFSHVFYDENPITMTSRDTITVVVGDAAEIGDKPEYRTMKAFFYNAFNVVELGRKSKDGVVEKIERDERYHQKSIFKSHCSMVLDFSAATSSRAQWSFMVVHSSAPAGSEEQIECLRMSTLIFVRPANVPFH